MIRRTLLSLALLVGVVAPTFGVVSSTRVGDANYTVLRTDVSIVTTTAFTTARTWTLPAANTTCIGQNCQPAANQLQIFDTASAVTSSNTLTIARASGDTINGAASDITVNYAGARIFAVPTSPSNWQIYISTNASVSPPASFGTVTADAIAGGDASLGITGLAAAQGGAIVVTGGTSSTGGNAGGAVSLVGGTPGATGVGGAVNITSGAGGATSGTAGAIAIAVGSATSGNGESITISAGNGAGGTNSGGDVNLVPGDAVSTGAPGTVKVNGDANLMCATFFSIGAPAAATDTVFFVATRPLLVTSVSQVHAVAAGGASNLQVTKDTGTDAPGAGTDLLTNNSNAGFDLNATANTVQTGTLTATVATKTLAAGNRLAVDFADAIQSSSGITVTACMAPL